LGVPHCRDRRGTRAVKASLASDLSVQYRGPKTLRNKSRGEGFSMSTRRPWTVASSRIARRDVLKTVAAAGFTAAMPAIPAFAQEEPASQPALAETLARYAASLRYEEIPGDVVRLARRTILDTIGCAFGGYDAGPSKIAIKLAGDVSAKQPATVLIS